MGDLTPHFSRHEFGLPQWKAAEHHLAGAEYPAEWVETRLRPLCELLEVLREALGGPRITVISGFRPHDYNTAVDGAQDSQHLHGRAADIKVHGVHPDRVADTALALHEAGKVKLGGLGRYDTFTHVDVRPESLALWDRRKP